MEIVTANSLDGGRVVFLTTVGWSLDIDAAEILEGKEAVEAALARANADTAANRVVEPYAIAVSRTNGRLVPMRLRERIRAEGPTTGNSKLVHNQGHDAGDPPPPCGDGVAAKRLGEGSDHPRAAGAAPHPAGPADRLPSPRRGERVVATAEP